MITKPHVDRRVLWCLGAAIVLTAVTVALHQLVNTNFFQSAKGRVKHTEKAETEARNNPQALGTVTDDSRQPTSPIMSNTYHLGAHVVCFRMRLRLFRAKC